MGTCQQTWFFIWACRSLWSLCGFDGQWPLTVTLKEKPQTNQQKKSTKKLSDSQRTSQVHIHKQLVKPLIPKSKWLPQTSSCMFYCYVVLWLRIPALLKWNHLNPVGPAFVIAEGFSTRMIGGVLYTLSLDWSHYLCFTCSPTSLFRVCNKESGLLSPTGGVVCTCTIQ